MHRDGGFTCATFEVRNRRADRPIARRTGRHERLATYLETAAKLVDLLECIPALTPVLFDIALRQGRVSGETAAHGGLVDLEDELGHLPARKSAERFLTLGGISLLPDKSLHLERLGL